LLAAKENVKVERGNEKQEMMAREDDREAQIKEVNAAFCTIILLFIF